MPIISRRAVLCRDVGRRQIVEHADQQAGITVADAVATAGGLTYRANEGKVFLRRAGSHETVIVPLEGAVRVYPGDNLRVAERYF